MLQTLVFDTVKYNRSDTNRKIAECCPVHCQRFRKPPYLQEKSGRCEKLPVTSLSTDRNSAMFLQL